QEITDENIFEYSKKIIDLIDLKDDFLKIMVEGYLILSDVHPHNTCKSNLIKLLDDYIQVVLELPYNSNEVQCYQADCRQLPLAE
ncbi:hypothetical protein, partial [Klebsiella pneumoniae]